MGKPSESKKKEKETRKIEKKVETKKILLIKKKKKKPKKKQLKFVINCSQPVDDDIFDMASFEKFLRDSMKVNGKKGQLGDDVTIIRDHSKISVTSGIHFSKRYLKY